jgi:flagellar motor component MotA
MLKDATCSVGYVVRRAEVIAMVKVNTIVIIVAAVMTSVIFMTTFMTFMSTLFILSILFFTV